LFHNLKTIALLQPTVSNTFKVHHLILIVVKEIGA